MRRRNTSRPTGLTVFDGGRPSPLGSDIVEGVSRIQGEEQAGPDRLGQFDPDTVLLEHGLADEVMLLVFPVLLGTGKRLFADGTPPRELALVSMKAVPSGVIISAYRTNGPLRTGTFGDKAA